MSGQLIAESLTSPDESVRFDALAMINEFGLDVALPQLGELLTRLQSDASASAPFEAIKVKRIIRRLDSRA